MLRWRCAWVVGAATGILDIVIIWNIVYYGYAIWMRNNPKWFYADTSALAMIGYAMVVLTPLSIVGLMLVYKPPSSTRNTYPRFRKLQWLFITNFVGIMFFWSFVIIETFGWYWTIPCSGIILTITWKIVRNLRGPQTDYPACKICGYNLTGNTSGVCPECGTDFSPILMPHKSSEFQ